MKKIFKKQTYMQPNQKRSRQHLRLYVIEKIFSKIITDYKPFDLEHRELHFQTGWKQQKWEGRDTSLISKNQTTTTFIDPLN